MTETRYKGVLTGAAGLVIVALTCAAFWLSYAHLHAVADAHGLGGSPARAWAWPGCLDLFIISGELLMLRAALARVHDWCAIGLVAVGSGGSIALNVLGVTGHDPLAYVTAGVPPTAALLAFGALMRQVHTALVQHTAQVTTPDTEVHTPGPDEPPAEWFTQAEPVDTAPDEVDTPSKRLSAVQARAAIEDAWAQGLSLREAGRLGTRAHSFAKRVYDQLDADRAARTGAQLMFAGDR